MARKTTRTKTLRPTLADPDNDPFLWLEEVDGDRATAWADAQSQATHQAVGRCALRRRPGRVGRADGPARQSAGADPARRLALQFLEGCGPSARRLAADDNGVLSDRGADWEILLDVDALAAAEGEDWIWQGASTLPPEHARAILRLSRGGSDAVGAARIRSRHASTSCPMASCCRKRKAARPGWTTDTLLLSTRTGRRQHRPDMPAAFGCGIAAHAWSEGPVLFQTDPTNMVAWGAFDRVANRVVFVEKTGFFDAKIWIGDRSGPRQLAGPADRCLG